MIINPNTAIDNGWIKFPEWMTDEQKASCIQPNGLDISMDAIYGFDHTSYFILTDDAKIMRKQNKISAVDLPNYGIVYPIHGVVDVMSDFYVNIPAGYAGYLTVRSTLNRNGLFVTSGLFDSLYTGNIGFALHNRGQTAYIAPHTKVAQFVFVKSDDSGMAYAGGYNTQPGQHWVDALDAMQINDNDPVDSTQPVNKSATIVSLPSALKDIQPTESTQKITKKSKS
jgi:deoxycytidine triphosphate deaminase